MSEEDGSDAVTDEVRFQCIPVLQRKFCNSYWLQISAGLITGIDYGCSCFLATCQVWQEDGSSEQDNEEEADNSRLATFAEGETEPLALESLGLAPWFVRA